MKEYKLYIITILFLLFLNILFNFVIFKHVKLSNIFLYFLESVIVCSFLFFLFQFFSVPIQKILFVFVFLLLIVFYTIQINYYSVSGTFCSMFSIVHGSQVFYYFSTVIRVFIRNIIPCLLFFLSFAIISYIYIKTDYKCFDINNYVLISSLFLAVLILFVSVSLLSSDDIYSRKNLIKTVNYQSKNIQSFGFISGMSIDLYRYLFGANYKLYISNDTNLNKYDKAKYNVLDYSFDTPITELNNYMKNSVPTKKNEYSGIFKNKNLIFITAESLDFNIIDKDLTPTLYKLNREGITFNNFYTPIYYASTSDAEYTIFTGLFPKKGVWSYVKMRSKDYPFSYAGAFNDRGYESYSYHDGYFHVYNRNIIMPKLGYSYEGCLNGLEKRINCNLHPQSDYEMFKATYSDFKKAKHFNVYYMSVSGHLPYNFNENDMSKKYEDKVKKIEYSDNVKAYISANIDLDKGLEYLINNLEKDKLLDDTVIVIVPDHYPYGLTYKEYSEFKDLSNNYDKHKSGMIIYNPKVKSKQIDKYSSNIDILPTILNMFGIDYDSRLMIGKDIMSDSEGIVIFNDHSFLTKEGFYDEENNRFNNRKINNTYITKKRKEVFNKINASSIIFNTNYYKYFKK